MIIKMKNKICIFKCKKNKQIEEKIEEQEIELTVSERIELLKLHQEDFLFRHTLYWNLFYKNIYAILGLLALPHALHSIIVDKPWVLAFFPFAGSFLCLFSHLLMQTENVRMTASKNRMNEFGKGLGYKKICLKNDVDFKKRKKLSQFLLSGGVSKKMNIFYWILAAAGLAEGIMFGLGFLF